MPGQDPVDWGAPPHQGPGHTHPGQRAASALHLLCSCPLHQVYITLPLHKWDIPATVSLLTFLLGYLMGILTSPTLNPGFPCPNGFFHSLRSLRKAAAFYQAEIFAVHLDSTLLLSAGNDYGFTTADLGTPFATPLLTFKLGCHHLSLGL